jgi:hypothetical protein
MANSIALAGLYRHLYFGSTKRLDANRAKKTQRLQPPEDISIPRLPSE